MENISKDAKIKRSITNVKILFKFHLKLLKHFQTTILSNYITYTVGITYNDIYLLKDFQTTILNICIIYTVGIAYNDIEGGMEIIFFFMNFVITGFLGNTLRILLMKQLSLKGSHFPASMVIMISYRYIL